jgi:hypothetical protein
MRYTLLFFLLFISCIPKAQTTTNEKNLIATKNNRVHKFKTGTAIKILYKQGDAIQKWKGKLNLVTLDGLYLRSFNKADTVLKFVNLNSIISVTKLLRKQRLVFAIGGSTLFTGGLILANATKLPPNSPVKDNFGPLLFYLFGVLPGAGYLLSIPVTFFQEKITTKSIKREWHFTIQ